MAIEVGSLALSGGSAFLVGGAGAVADRRLAQGGLDTVPIFAGIAAGVTLTRALTQPRSSWYGDVLQGGYNSAWSSLGWVLARRFIPS